MFVVISGAAYRFHLLWFGKMGCAKFPLTEVDKTIHRCMHTRIERRKPATTPTYLNAEFGNICGVYPIQQCKTPA